MYYEGYKAGPLRELTRLRKHAIAETFDWGPVVPGGVGGMEDAILYAIEIMNSGSRGEALKRTLDKLQKTLFKLVLNFVITECDCDQDIPEVTKIDDFYVKKLNWFNMVPENISLHVNYSEVEYGKRE